MQVGLLFGITDVEFSKKPRSGWGVFAGAGKLQIGRWSLAKRRRHMAVVIEPIAQVPLTGQPATLQVSVRGRRVVAKAGSTALSGDLPAAVDGFTGLSFLGEGFVEISGLSIKK